MALEGPHLWSMVQIEALSHPLHARLLNAAHKHMIVKEEEHNTCS
jgi:hypothetical protein